MTYFYTFRTATDNLSILLMCGYRNVFPPWVFNRYFLA